MPPYFLRTDATSWYVVTSIGTWVIDKKTHRVKGFVPEHPILRANLTALEATIGVLEATQGMEGTDELRTQATRALASFAAAVEKQTTAAAHGEVMGPVASG